MADAETLLSDLCSICHVNPPKYRCPRCSTRTCSLPCTRRHKLWSQCSGVRDPAAYMKRNELATEAAFDRDFNFITGIERNLERAERDIDNRGIDLAHGTQVDQTETESAQDSASGLKRKRPNQGLAKGEAGFLRGAEASGVKVIRAPKGMSRNKQNGSRLHSKHKCLSWTVEWITADGGKCVRNSVLETCSIAEAYDRCFPCPKEQEPVLVPAKHEQDTQDHSTTTNGNLHDPSTDSERKSDQLGISEPPESLQEKPSGTSAETDIKQSDKVLDQNISHRGLFFFLHRPRMTSKKPVLAPLSPSATLSMILRKRTVLEFPTIYALPDGEETLLADQDKSPFILEGEYLRTAGPEETRQSMESDEDDAADDETMPESSVNLQNVDENKVLEVLKQDLFEPVQATHSVT